MRLQEVACSGGAVELTPRATAGMAIGAQIAQSQPASVVTVGMGAKVHRGVDSTGTSVGRGHRIGWHRRRGQRMHSLLLTGRTGGLVRQADKRFRLLAACASRRDGRGGPRCLSPAGAWPCQRQHNKQPQESQDQELIVTLLSAKGGAPERIIDHAQHAKSGRCSTFLKPLRCLAAWQVAQISS
jgi:hypothetical protein